MAARRLQRYADFLNAFDYEIEYVKSKKNYADELSRLPMPLKKSNKKEYTYLNYVEQESFSCLDHKVIAKQTRKDRLLSQITLYLRNGWPEKKMIEDDVKPLVTKKEELHIEQDCIMWGYRVIILNKLKAVILTELHASHAGIVEMKATARSFFWWPGMDKEIEEIGSTCRDCIEVKDNPSKSEINPWKWPEKPWQRVHTDFIGPYKGYDFLLLIDAKTKWPEVLLMKSTTASKTVDAFRKVFSQFGLPLQVVSDNGPQYTISTFTDFLKKLGIKQTLSAVKHPASNGAAENFVKTFKRKIKILLRRNKPIQTAIDMILFEYRTTKHCTTGETPAKLMLGQELQTKFDLLRPDIRIKQSFETDRQVRNSRGKRTVTFNVNETVWAKNFSVNSSSWMQAVVTNKLGPVTYEVKLKSGKIVKRHIDQLKRDGKNIGSNIRAPGTEKESKRQDKPTLRRSPRIAEKRYNAKARHCLEGIQFVIVFNLLYYSMFYIQLSCTRVIRSVVKNSGRECSV